MRVVVTGASGFIGRHLIASLLVAGHKVIAVLHKHTLPVHFGTDALRVVWGDFDNLSPIRTAIAKADAICHLAALVIRGPSDSWGAERSLQVNSLFALQIAKFALEKPKTRMIFLSTGQAYHYSEAPVSEDAALYPAERSTYYLASKLLGELYVEHLRRSRSLPAITLRLGCCYGPGMRVSVVSSFMNSAAAGLPLTVFDGGRPTHDFVYVSDVVDVIMAALEAGDPGVYNVGSGRACSILELAQTVAGIFPDRDVPIEVEPPRDGMPASFSTLSIEKARETWGYLPLSLKEGLVKYREQMEKLIT